MILINCCHGASVRLSLSAFGGVLQRLGMESVPTDWVARNSTAWLSHLIHCDSEVIAVIFLLFFYTVFLTNDLKNIAC